MTQTRVLFATSEMYPLIKTGGLADISYSLPKSLLNNGVDVRVILPAYKGIKDQLKDVTQIASITGFAIPDNGILWEGTLLDCELKVWLVDFPQYFERAGSPYASESGEDYPDNCQRFAVFSRVIMEASMGHLGLDWKPDLVHCNDWQTALAPAFLSFHDAPPVIFTIHNLAYQGIFPAEQFSQLALPDSWWSPDKLEYHGRLCLIKAGIICADAITTVSPTYAREILTEDQGCGLEGLLRHYQSKLTGIINGIDDSVWNPATDEFIEYQYDLSKIHDKTKNKTALQSQLGLPVNKSTPMIGVVSRLVHQKGIDLILEAIAELKERQVQWVILGSGASDIETELLSLANQIPEHMSVSLEYSEVLAHRIEAAADFFLMPSRYEPCGLNQMYSLKYGAVPIVTNTGGLADTVTNIDLGKSKGNGKTESSKANGFVIDSHSSTKLIETLKHALKLFRTKKSYRHIQKNGMSVNFSWHASSKKYKALYETTIKKQKRPLVTHQIKVPVTEAV